MATARTQQVKIRKIGFSVLSHPADIGLEVKAKTINQLFQYCQQGLYYLLLGPTVKLGKKKIQKKIVISGLDREQLLVKLLNEVIFCLMVKKQFWNKLKIGFCREARKLSAVFSGYRLAAGNLFQHEIKSATYHGLRIERRKNVLVARVIFDI